MSLPTDPSESANSGRRSDHQAFHGRAFKRRDAGLALPSGLLVAARATFGGLPGRLATLVMVLLAVTLVPTPVSSNFTAITSNQTSTFTSAANFAVTGAVSVWGNNANGQSGTGLAATEILSPTAMGAINTWTTIASGHDHACGARSDGTLWCWGKNLDGQLGLGNTTNTTVPTQVGTETTWASVAAAYNHTCATGTNNTLWCWGSNSNGQLGQGNLTQKTSPTQVGTDTNWDKVTSGHLFTCAVRTVGTLWCWGDNTEGQLGVGSTQQKTSPTQVGTDTNWKSVDGGYQHTCGTRTNNTLYCWGTNNQGQLGQGNTTRRTSPTQVGTGTTWKSVSLGDDTTTDGHTCATQTNNTLWCWGGNSQGQLGQGNLTNLTSPTQVGTDTTWNEVSAALRFTCARKTDHSVWCWGWNTAGRLGQGDTIQRTSPTVVPGVTARVLSHGCQGSTVFV